MFSTQPACPAQSRDEVFRATVGAILQLPEELRRIFIARHYRGESLSELAQRTGTTIQAVQASLAAAEALFSAHLVRHQKP
ncbi:MAG: hypothetical protein Kow00109_07870 [Acidobacteriota bacterium]